MLRMYVSYQITRLLDIAEKKPVQSILSMLQVTMYSYNGKKYGGYQVAGYSGGRNLHNSP